MGEVVGAFGGRKAFEPSSDGGPQRLESAGGFGAQQLLELGKDLLRSGEYGGRNHSDAERASIASRTPATL